MNMVRPSPAGSGEDICTGKLFQAVLAIGQDRYFLITKVPAYPAPENIYYECYPSMSASLSGSQSYLEDRAMVFCFGFKVSKSRPAGSAEHYKNTQSLATRHAYRNVVYSIHQSVLSSGAAWRLQKGVLACNTACLALQRYGRPP